VDLKRLTISVANVLKGTKTLDALVDDLRTFPELAIFDNKLQWKGGPGVVWSLRLLGEWLESRARNVGASEAVRDVERYVTTTAIPYEEILILAGVALTKRIRLTGGIELIPFSQLPATVWKEHVEELFGKSWANYRPSVALRRASKRPRIHTDRDPEVRWHAEFQRLDDVRLCITALGPHAPLYLEAWIQAPNWVPEIGGSAQIPEPLNVGNYPRNVVADLHGLTQLHKKWVGLNEAERNRLRVALKRINSGLRRLDRVDFAIDLGIAMEAIFLSDKEPEQGELAFTLRLRAARYLASNKGQRQEISKIFLHLYRLRSKAVHTGELKPIEARISTESALSRGYQLVTQAIRRIITQGKPDWSEMIFD